MNDESRDQLDKLDRDKLEKVHEAIYGDGNGNPGMQKMVKEMYEFYSGTKLGGKLIRNIVAFIASLCIALYVIVQVLRGHNPF
jgi:hypothetical protein